MDTAPQGHAPSSAGGSRRRWDPRRATPGAQSKQTLQNHRKTQGGTNESLRSPDVLPSAACGPGSSLPCATPAARALHPLAPARPSLTRVWKLLGVHRKLFEELHGIQLVSLQAGHAGAHSKQGGGSASMAREGRTPCRAQHSRQQHATPRSRSLGRAQQPWMSSGWRHVRRTLS